RDLLVLSIERVGREAAIVVIEDRVFEVLRLVAEVALACLPARTAAPPWRHQDGPRWLTLRPGTAACREKLPLVNVGVAAPARDRQWLVADEGRRPASLGRVATGASRLGVLAGQRKPALLVMVERQLRKRRRLVASRA